MPYSQAQRKQTQSRRQWPLVKAVRYWTLFVLKESMTLALLLFTQIGLLVIFGALI